MGKTVALVYPTHGHVTPCLAVVEALTRRGEEVVFYSTPRARAQVERSGAIYREYEADDAAFNPDPPTDGLLADMTRLLALSERLLPRLVDEIAAIDADYLLLDTKSVWGRLVGQALGLPAVTLSVVFALTRNHVGVPDLVCMLYGGAPETMLLAGLEDLSRYHETARRVAARHGVTAPDLIDFLANPQPLTVVFTSRAFQIRGDSFGDAYRFVGTAIASDRERHAVLPPGLAGDDDVPLVYVSLGTTFNEAPAFYRACLEAFAGAPYRVVISTGGRAIELPAPSGNIAGNIAIVPFVPQLRVLARARAFVTHGGMNSANEGLLYGVPMVVVPQRGDQHLVAARVAELGAGLAVRPAEATPARLREAVDRLLTEVTFRERARALGRSLVEAGGAAAAADAILEAVGHARPLTVDA
jgi:MGT family glycosyltransferase